MRYLMACLSFLLASPLHCPKSSSATGKAIHGLRRVMASWYGPRFEGKKMASGIRFCSALPVVAHRSLPLGSIVRIGCGSASALGIVLDRGPWFHGRDLDLSCGLAAKLGLLRNGVGEVTVEVLGVEPRERWSDVLLALA